MVRNSYTSRVTSKGQITVPQEIRRRLGLREGDQVEFVTGNRCTIVRRVEQKQNPFKQFAGMLPAFPGGKKEINAWLRDLRDEK
jgi:antitoxin PrlF